MNNNYDRDPSDVGLDSRQANNNQAKGNILELLRTKEQRRKVRAQAIRASYISPQDQF